MNGAGQPPPTPPDDAIAPSDVNPPRDNNPLGDTHLSSAAAAPPATASPADTTAPASSFETPPRRVFDWGATLPQRGRLLGIDYGSKRLGVAVSNLDQTLASPVSNRDRTDIEQDARFFRRQVAEYGAVGIVVGLPVHLSGDEGQKARESRQFGAWLAQVCQVPVRFHDERFSTRFADEQLRDAGLKASQRQGRRDMLAAQYLLQAYLESRDSAGEAPAGLRS